MKIKDIYNFLQAQKIIGDEEKEITTLSPINEIIDNSIVCIDNDKYLEAALNSNANALILT